MWSPRKSEDYRILHRTVPSRVPLEGQAEERFRVETQFYAQFYTQFYVLLFL